MSQVERERQERKPTDVRQREIVDAAMRILAVEGPRHLTAKNIATEVGISSGAIFRHFATMDAIADAVIDRMEEILFEDFPLNHADPMKRLELFFNHRVQVVVEHRQVASMLLSDHLKQTAGEERASRVEGFKLRTRAFVKECLQSAIEEGKLTAVDPEACSVLLLGAVLALAQASSWRGAHVELEPLGKRVWSLLERMLRDGHSHPAST